MSHPPLAEMFEAMKASLLTLLTSEDPTQQELKEKVRVMGQAVVWSLVSESKSASLAVLSPVIPEPAESLVSMFPCIKMEKQQSSSISCGSNLRTLSRTDFTQNDSGRDTSSSSATTPGSLNWSLYDVTPQMFQMNHVEPIDWIKQYRLTKKFTKEQVLKLIEFFKKRPYVMDKDKYQLAEETGLTAKQVSNWFSNARRSMKKKNNSF